MPRLSLWKPEKTNNYRYLDKIISEQYTVGGLDIHIHKYLGPKLKADGTGDATQPVYDETNPLFIEDLLLLENRNREYEDDVYTMRGVYRVQDIDFDLTQFGLFLQSDTLFITFHYNDMIDRLGRKLMAGDVLEIPNLKDYHPLDPSAPKALPRFYVIQDADYASEGFSPTWLPHLWRVKATPMVASQEYNDILDDYMDNEGGIDGDDGMGNGSGTLRDYLSTCSTNIELEDAIVAQAEIEVPLSGYDVSNFYVIEYDEFGNPIDTHGFPVDSDQVTVDNDTVTADRGVRPTDPDGTSRRCGYLIGDGLPPNGFPVTPAVTFPGDAEIGDYVLRLDYKPNRLFRFNGTAWIHIEDDVRTDLYMDGETQRSNFTNNTDTVNTNDRGEVPSRQSLSDLLRPDKDN